MRYMVQVKGLGVPKPPCSTWKTETTFKRQKDKPTNVFLRTSQGLNGHSRVPSDGLRTVSDSSTPQCLKLCKKKWESCRESTKVT